MRFHHGLGSALHQPIISAEMQGAPRIYFGGLKGSADLKAAVFYILHLIIPRYSLYSRTEAPVPRCCDNAPPAVVLLTTRHKENGR